MQAEQLDTKDLVTSIESLPPVEDSPGTGSGNQEAKKLFGANEAKQTLDVNVRRIAGYGAAILALVLYGCGIYAIAVFMGLTCYPRAKAEEWHIVVAVLIALFSVPTVLMISVLRGTNGNAQAGQDDQLAEAVGQKIIQMAEKWLDK
jgi:hypothetical protein